MDIEKEIRLAYNRIACKFSNTNCNEIDIDIIVKNYVKQFNNNDYDFSKTEAFVITKNHKKRYLKHYMDLKDNSISIENILCQCVKQILDRKFKLKFPNRNKIMENLFSMVKTVKQMEDFTIVKFDFKDFYNSLSADYVFNKIIDKNITDRIENALVREYIKKTKFTFAGLRPSNTISEIIAKEFDTKILAGFYEYGLIFYERYVDDCFIILNNYIAKDEIRNRLNNILFDVFYDKFVKSDDKCKTKFQDNKFIYISKRDINDKTIPINFLGYEFYFSKVNGKVKLQYGITEEKRKKYENKVLNFMHEFLNKNSLDYNKLVLLRHKLKAFCSRTVYQIKLSNGIVWREKGFISNYRELRFMDLNQDIELDTRKFLTNNPIKCFEKETSLIKGLHSFFETYKLYRCLQKNKTILLVNHIGYDYDSLCGICKQVGVEVIDSNGKKKNYATLVRDYLVKVRVGY